MEERRFVIGLMKGFAAAKLIVLALFLFLFLREPWCGTCRGAGRHLSLTVTQPTGTERCHVVLSRDGRKVWERHLPVVATVAWMGGGVVVPAGLFAGLKALACPLCARQGRLLLEVEAPGGDPERRAVECPACEGRGSLTQLDRWLAGV